VRLRVEPHCACAFLYDGWLHPQLIAQTSHAVESTSTSQDGVFARLGVDAKAQAQALDAAILDLAKTMPVEGTRMFVEIADSLVHLDVAVGDFADHTEMFLKNIPIYIQESRTFRLPQDNSTDLIMVGPGTGVAPFRAFLEQRTLEGATGRNWLIFGEQRRATDFLYGDEFLDYQKDLLNQLGHAAKAS